MSFPIRSVILAAALVGAGACGRTPAGPTPDPVVPDGPRLTCPGPVLAEVVAQTDGVVEYGAPQVSGGASPISTACVAPSGSRFLAGDTTVTCTATDSLSRQAQCSFVVTMSVVPLLKGTKVVAFGDSITWGEVSLPASVQYYDPAGSYPTVLGQKLGAKYKAQTITIVNEGIPGERILDPGSGKGEGRIEALVVRERPDVLIVFEGVNDLNSGSSPDDVSEALRRGVRRAVRQNVPLVLVSTILPGVAGRTKPPNPDKVNALNAEIRSWVSSERAVLVDNFNAFEPTKDKLIGVDGLHPTLAGYERLAEEFFNAIRDRFEEPLPSPSVFLRPR